MSDYTNNPDDGAGVDFDAELRAAAQRADQNKQYAGKHMRLAHAIVGQLIGAGLLEIRLDDDDKWPLEYAHATLVIRDALTAANGGELE